MEWLGAFIIQSNLATDGVTACKYKQCDNAWVVFWLFNTVNRALKAASRYAFIIFHLLEWYD